jgi:hypothetical protein
VRVVLPLIPHRAPSLHTNTGFNPSNLTENTWDYGGSRRDKLKGRGGRQGQRNCVGVGSSCVRFLTELLLHTQTLGQINRIPLRNQQRRWGIKEGGGEGRGGDEPVRASKREEGDEPVRAVDGLWVGGMAAGDKVRFGRAGVCQILPHCCAFW